MPDQVPFSEWAKSLPADMSADQYDQVRMKWFTDNVKPRLDQKANLHSAWERFKSNTERAPVKYPHGAKTDMALVGFSSALAKSLSGANKLVEDAVSVVTGSKTGGEAKKTIFHDYVKKFEGDTEEMSKKYFKLAERERRSKIPYYVGEAAGYLPAFELSAAGGGAIAGALNIPKVGIAAHMLRGGLAFGTFEAAFTTEGDRLTAGARGFVEGFALDGALGLLGKTGRYLVSKLRKSGASDKELDQIVTNILSGDVKEVPEGIDRSIAESVQEDAVSSRMEGRPAFIKEDPSIKGVRVLLHDVEGGANTVIVRPGEEQNAVREILTITRKGGVVDGIMHNPGSMEQLQRFMRASADAGAERYEGIKVIRTAEGQASKIALENELDAKPTAIVGESEILTQEPKFGPPDPEKIKHSIETLKDEESYPLSKGARDRVRRDIEMLWDDTIPDQRKEVAADRLRQWELKDLIPEQWRREPVIEGLEEGVDTDILNRAKELGVSEEELTRLEEITGKEPKRSGRGRYEEPFDDKFQASVTWGKPLKEGERPFDIEQPSPTEPVSGLKPGERPQGPAPREEFFPEAKPEGWKDLTHSKEGVELENRLFQQAKKELPDAPFSKVNERFQQLKREYFERGVQPMNNIRIPESEQYILEESADGPQKVLLGETPRRYALQVTSKQMRSIIPGAQAVTSRPGYLNEILERLGMELVQDEAYKPTILYKKGIQRGTVYHEGLHVDKFHVPEALDVLWEEGNKAADSIGNGLKQGLRAYKNLSEGAMREEAFVHVATAIRTGDVEALQELVKLDGTVAEVFDMVNKRAVGLYEKTMQAVDSAQSRILQRKMHDLILRTTDDRAWELMNKTSDAMINWWYDAESNVWKLRSAESLIEQVFSDFPKVVDEVMKRTGEDWAPSATLFAEAKGVRGSIAPRGAAPVKNPHIVDTPPDVKWSGVMSISGWYRPMGSWVSSLHTRVNEALSKHGKSLPIYPRWKDVDEAYRAGDQWMQDNYAEAANLLKGIKNEKQYAMFDTLASDPKHWDQVGKQLGLTKDDIVRVGEIDKWLGKLRDETGILVKNFLRDELPRLRGSNYNLERVYGMLQKTPSEMSTFERLITEGKLDPRSRHIGSFMNTMLREGFSKKFTDKPLKALEKLVEQKAANGQYILGNMRQPLVNYTRYMRGIPDVTGQIMNRTVGDFFGALGEQTTKMNKYLPSFARLPEKFEYPRSIINKLMVWSYASGLGLRASIPIRDAIQVYTTTAPVLGPAKFLRGLTEFGSRGMSFAQENGALLQKNTIGDLYGDIFQEIPAGASNDFLTKMSQKLLAPSRWGHNIGRAIGFYGEYFSALDAVKKFRKGAIDVDKLVGNETSLWFADEPAVQRLVGQLHDKGFSDEEVARNIALEFVDLTLWPYRRGAQPSLLRTGAGRILGQYGMWPMNYLDFVKRLGKKTAEHPKQALTTIAMWGAANYTAVWSMNKIGADAGKWFWFSPAAVEMSPHAKFAKDLFEAPKDSPEGREARRNVLEYPLTFFPSGIEMRNIERAMESGEALWNENGLTEQGLRVLGFAPLREEEDRTIGEEVLHQFGYRKNAEGEIKPERER